MEFKSLEDLIRKFLIRWQLPGVLDSLKSRQFPLGAGTFGAPDFNYPFWHDLDHLRIIFRYDQVLLITSTQQTISQIPLSSVDGVTASREGGQIFSGITLLPEHQPLQNASEAQALLDVVFNRHKASGGWKLVKEKWSGRMWVNNIDGSHRLSCVAEANSRLNLNLSLQNVSVTTYEFNKEIVKRTPGKFRFLLSEDITDILNEIPGISRFMETYDVRNPWRSGFVRDHHLGTKLVVGVPGEFERNLRIRLKEVSCRFIEIP